MDASEFNQTLQDAAAAHEAGRSEEAAADFRRVLDDASVPELDRSVVAVNLATVLSATGGSASDIEAAFDRGVALETRWSRGFVREHKAAWLASVGRTDGAIAIFQQLGNEGWGTFPERQRWDQNLATLTGG